MQTQSRQQISLERAHRDHARSLYAHAYHKLHDRTLGRDLVQDTFTKTWRYLVNGGKIDVMRVFLYHILDCLIIDEYRKKKTISLDELIESGFEPTSETAERLLNRLDGRSAMGLIDVLPRKYQKVIYMRYVSDLSHTEIALLTGQSKSTVAVQAHRGLEKLRKLYFTGEIEVKRNNTSKQGNMRAISTEDNLAELQRVRRQD